MNDHGDVNVWIYLVLFFVLVDGKVVGVTVIFILFVYLSCVILYCCAY
jgi:uncharacterized BrkB/YihY/UPF0761 family membrane protein